MANALCSSVISLGISNHPTLGISLSPSHGGQRRTANSSNSLSPFKGSRRPLQMMRCQAAEDMAEKLKVMEKFGEFEGGGKDTVREKFMRMIGRVQNEVCSEVERLDGKSFEEEVWERPGGGGGITRVLEHGNVWERAGVNVSVVHGPMDPAALKAANPESAKKSSPSVSNINGKTSPDVSNINGKTSPDVTKPPPNLNFWAASLSSVMHPINPFAPTMHFNYRYFETINPKESADGPKKWWFGGGVDITPSYLFEDDVKNFHMIQKQVCDKYDESFYPKFKKLCDDFFYIKHRGETRGLGGIFFDNLKNYHPETLLAFTTDLANAVIPSYIPLMEKRKDMPYTEKEKKWQNLRKGRYLEFNLCYDRGTMFGIKTDGRLESIMMSLPFTASWDDNDDPLKGSEEWKLLEACRNPKEWV